MSLALQLGAANIKKKERDVLYHAIIKTQSYYNGLKAPGLSVARFTRYWCKFKNNSFTRPQDLSDTFESHEQKKREAYVDVILRLYPKLLYELFRYAVSVIGSSSRTNSIVNIMNKKTAVTYPECPIRSDLKLTPHHFWVFFNKFNGKLLCPTTKPRLTDEQKYERIIWAKKWLSKVLDPLPNKKYKDDVHYCFLNEKWFYTTSQRKKMKILPKAPFETEEQAKPETKKNYKIGNFLQK